MTNRIKSVTPQFTGHQPTSKRTGPVKIGRSHGRKAFAVNTLPKLKQLSHALSQLANKKSLKNYKSITAQSPSACKPQIPKPRAQKPPREEPLAMQKLRADNKEAKRLEKELPEVPKEIKGVKSTGGASAPKEPSLPLDKDAFSKALNETKTVDGLIRLWNHLNSPIGKAAFSLEERMTLKTRFPGRLNMVSKQPGQARLIKNEVINAMIPDLKKRNDIGAQILENRLRDSSGQ